MVYSLRRKVVLLEEGLPKNHSIFELTKKNGISDTTLYNLRQQARSEGKLMPDSGNNPVGWLSRDKYAMVLDTAAMSKAGKAECCCKRGYCQERIGRVCQQKCWCAKKANSQDSRVMLH